MSGRAYKLSGIGSGYSSLETRSLHPSKSILPPTSQAWHMASLVTMWMPHWWYLSPLISINEWVRIDSVWQVSSRQLVTRHMSVEWPRNHGRGGIGRHTREGLSPACYSPTPGEWVWVGRWVGGRAEASEYIAGSGWGGIATVCTKWTTCQAFQYRGPELITGCNYLSPNYHRCHAPSVVNSGCDTQTQLKVHSVPTDCGKQPSAKFVPIGLPYAILPSIRTCKSMSSVITAQ